MDTNRLRKNSYSLKHKIPKEIKDYSDGRDMHQYETRETFKPIIDTQKEIKETIDKKQDKLIEKLQENQQNIFNSPDVLSDVMSQQGSRQGSVHGINRWLSDLQSSFDPLDTIEESDGNNDDEDKNKNDDIFTMRYGGYLMNC